MKKSTFIVVVLALALGAFVYFYDSKRSVAPPSDEASWKMAFSMKPDDIAGLTLERKSGNAVFTKQGNVWLITQPVSTRADQTAISGIVNDLSSAKIQRSFAPTDSLSRYGLDQPAVTIEFQQKSGMKHTICLGDKDFSGSVVYALVDTSQNVDLLPVSLLDETDQPSLQLRDRSLLELNNAEITGITLVDPSGMIAITKNGSAWAIIKPKRVLADSSAADSLASSLVANKFTDVASETPDNLAKYGLVHPAVTIDVTTKSKQQFHLLVGKKAGDEYYARDAARPMVFEISSAIYGALHKTFFDLRDKSILRFDPSNLTTVEIHNANGTIECLQGKADTWTIVAPTTDKGKSIQSWKLLDPIQNARAKRIYDTPSAAILAHLAKPAIEITLTNKSGEKTTVNISAPAGDSAYVRTSAGPEVYEVNTQILKDLGFKASDLLK